MKCGHDAPRLVDFVFFFVALILVQVLQLLFLVLYPGNFDTFFAVNFITLSSLLVAFIALFYFCLRGCPSSSQASQASLLEEGAVLTPAESEAVDSSLLDWW